jgi:hypothetical protein
MGTVRYRERKRLLPEDTFTEEKKVQLLCGADFFDDAYGDPPNEESLKQMKRDWRRYRAKLMAEHINQHPGTRPYMWWFLESTEPRRLVSGHCRPLTDRLHEGTPELYDFDQKSRPEWETQADYLERLGLLTPFEQRYFKEEAPPSSEVVKFKSSETEKRSEAK